MPHLSKLYPVPSTLYTGKGFTLIEIIVTIGIIILVSTVTLPNLRQFNEDQKLESASSEFIQTLKQAQSGARSSIRCKTAPSVDWLLETEDKTYNLKTNCLGIEDPEVRKSATTYFSEETGLIEKTDDSCLDLSKSGDLIFIFKDNQIEGQCGEEKISAPLFITLEDSSENKVKIQVEETGLITKQEVE